MRNPIFRCSPLRCLPLRLLRSCDIPTQIVEHPGHWLCKTTEKGTMHEVLVWDISGPGQGYPNVWVPDVPGTSCPKTLSLGCFSVLTRATIYRSLWALQARNRKKVSKRVFSGVCKKVPENTRKSQKIHKIGLFGVFFDFFGYFRGLFCRPPKRLFLRLFCNFGPGGPEGSCKWSLGSQVFQSWSGGILFREYCFGRENSPSSAANSVSSAKNSVSSLWHTNNRLRGTHWVCPPELGESRKTHWVRCLKPYSPKPYS